LVSYDPGANTAAVLLGPGVNGGGVTDAILFPEGK
jgi:TolB protein